MTYKIPNEITELFSLSSDLCGEIIYVNPKKLICKDRLDIVAKYIYLDLRDKCIDYAKDLYKEHIRVMTRGSFVEPFSNKKSIESFLSAFDNVVSSMEKNGFDMSHEPIFVDETYKILDGAHRVASCLYLDVQVPVVVLPVKGEYNNYNQEYFEQYGMDADYLDLIIRYYLKLSEKELYCLNVWPSAKNHDDELLDIINDNFDIIYKKNVEFNENGAFLYLAQIYKEYSWAQEGDENFSGVYRKLLPCFPDFSPVKSFFLVPIKEVNLIETKEKMRAIYNLEKHSLHMTDNMKETIQMGEILLSNNTIDFLNHASVLKFKNTTKWLKEAIMLNEKNNSMVFCGSLVLALYGIREAHDVDYLCVNDDEESHNEYIDLYEMSLHHAIYCPNVQFSFFGVPFLTLERIKIFKKNRNEGKDSDDIRLIELFEAGKMETKKTKYLQIKRRIVGRIQGRIIRVLHLTGTFTAVRYIYRRIKGKKD